MKRETGHDGENVIITILGKKGSGKSTLAEEIIREYPRVLIMDSMGEYSHMKGVEEFWDASEAADRLIELKDEKRFLIDAMIIDDVDAMSLLAVAFEIPDILIVLEEASLYTSPHELPDEIAKILRYGRKRGVSMIVIARRPSEISRELTAQSDVLITFRQEEPRDVEYLRARLGDADAERAQHLAQYHVVIGGDRSLAPLAALSREGKTLTRPEERD